MTYTCSLSGSSLSPLSRKAPEQLIILLHGYGSNGEDLIALGKAWQKLLPDAEFIALNAPFRCAEYTEFPYQNSYQWFALENLDPALMYESMIKTIPLLNENLDRLLKERNLTDAELGLVGFSQGTMMALGAALKRKQACAGIVGYSGMFISSLSEQAVSFPEVLLIHGERDEIVKVENLSQSAEALTALGVKARTYVCANLDHSIDEMGLTLGGMFLVESFNKNNKQQETRS